MSDAMQVLAVAGALLAVAQVIASLPGGRRKDDDRAQSPRQAVESAASPGAWYWASASASTAGRKSGVRLAGH